MGARKRGKGECSLIRFNYNISFASKIVATNHIPQAQNIPKCVCGRPGPRWGA